MEAVDSQRPNPFPGLRPFRSDEHHLFFGREVQTAALLQLLRTNRFLAVVGTSGSGKSSLVRAGMIAELHGGTMTQAGSTWEVLLLRPGGSPIENLARAMVDADLYDPDDPSTLPRLLATLNRSRFGLVEAMKQSELFEPGTNLLVVVDQFEELFRFRQQGVDSEETAAAFVNLLLTASDQTECPIYVTITMRSDYLGDCSEIAGLAEAVNEGEYLIPRLLRDQKRDAIEKPIGVGGARISPLLVQRLLNDVGDDPDQLPVLQHALMRMWDVWSTGSDHNRPIDFGDFEATGGLASALSNHADEIFESLPDDRHRSACEKIFKALTEKGADNRGIRRPTRLAHLQAIANADRATVTTVLDAFRGPGVTFLMPGTEVELADRTVLDLSHESLMRGWQRLRGWVEDEAQSARVFRRLLDTARLWSEGKAGLFRDPDLQIALSWREQEAPNSEWAEQYGGHFEKAIGFLETSNAEAEAERQAKDAARQRELAQAQELAESRKQRLIQQQRAARRLRKLIAGLAVVAAIAGVACIAALIANHRANTLADVARQNEEKAKESQQQTADALSVVASKKAEVESSLSKAEAAEEAGRKLLYTTDMQLAPFVWQDDQRTAKELRDVLSKHIPPGNAAVAKPDLRGFEWYYYEHLLDHSAEVFSGHEAAVVGGAFTSDGYLVTLDQNGQVRRWDRGSQQEDKSSRRDLAGGASAQLGILSPDGRLAALAEGNKVRVFDSATGKETLSIDSPAGEFRRLAFSRDGDRLVIVDDKIRWCSSVNGEVIATVGEKYGRVGSIALSADGLTLAVVGHDPVDWGQRVSVFRLAAAAKTVTPLVKDLFATGGTLNASAISPDGQRVAYGSLLDADLSVMEPPTPPFQYVSAHASPLSALSFSPDGAKLATGDVQGIIKIWVDVQKLTPKSKPFLTLKGHQGAITAVGFSSDGKRLFSTSADKTARVWDLENAGPAVRQLERDPPVRAYVARFSSNGQLIAVAAGNVLRLWDAATGRAVRDLPAGNRGEITSVAFSPTDDRLLAIGFGSAQVALWDIDGGAEIGPVAGATDLPGFQPNANNGAAGALSFSPDGKYLVAGFGYKRTIDDQSAPSPLIVWEVATRRPIRVLNGHTGYCLSLDFSRDGTLLASGSRDGSAILWSVAGWSPIKTLENPDRGTNVNSMAGRGMVDDVAFSPDRRTLAMASRVGNVHLWDVAEGNLLATLKGHSNAVQAVVFSPDGRTLASAGSDRTVRLWNVEARRELVQLDPGSVAVGSVTTLAFSPDGKQLVAGGRNSAVWSTAPNVWDDPERAAEQLRLLLHSNADFQSRIRMLSENLRLYAALEKLDAHDVRVQAALAATRANWHASRRAWPEAVADIDRLAGADPSTPAGWLRTPGLLRVGTALVRQNRPDVAATLLQGGAQRRADDGLPAIVKGKDENYVDQATGDLFFPLLAEVDKGLAQDPRDAGLHELRAELAGQENDFAGQAAHYAGAIEILAEQPAPAMSARLLSLYRRRGDAYMRLQKWSEAVDDYAHAITAQTTDPVLLSQHARALEALKNWDAAADDWSRVARGNPQGPKQLADFGRRLGAGGNGPSAKAARGKVRAFFEEMLAKDPENFELAVVALADLVLFVHGDRPDPDRDRIRFTAMRLTDPWAKLAAAYALDGRNEEALQYFSKALKRADSDQARRPIIEVAAAFDDLVSDLVKGQPDEPEFQLAMARQHAARGRQRLAEKQPAKAQAELEKSDAIYTRLLAEYPEPRWTVLTPTELKSAAGATLTKLSDNSILASGTNPAKDTYTVVAPTDLPRITAFRLEAMAHESLPRGGPGRVQWGNFALSEIALKAGPLSGAGKAAELKLSNPAADFEQVNYPVAASLDGNPGTAWSIDPLVGRNHTAVYEVESWPQIGLEGGTRLTFTLDFQFNNQHALGRFRLSVTSEATTAQAMQVRLNVHADEVADLHAALAEAHAQQGHTDESARDWQQAIAAYNNALADQPADRYLSEKLAGTYVAAGRTREGVGLLASLSAANPKDTTLALRTAALQAWFGMDKELAASRRRILDFAQGTNEAQLADCAAKACSLFPSPDKTEREAALDLGRTGVKVANGRAWNLLSLGMAEYRSSEYAAACQTLITAAEAVNYPPQLATCAAFYRAMSLFQQGKENEARKLATETVAKMTPLPKDENNPLAGNVSHDDLILWLAYKEAKALIKFDAVPPKADNDKG
jgi:WD40 repeat protein